MIDEYVALYHEYMDLYNDTLDSIASSASEIDTEFVNEYADLALNLAQTEDAKS